VGGTWCGVGVVVGFGVAFSEGVDLQDVCFKMASV
jgi:hypothetical protein